jgi:hypothetical protein
VKFRDIIFERTERTSALTIDEIAKILLKEYSHKELDIILNCRSPFYRGDNSTSPFLIIDPSLNKRVSPFSSNNYYNIFLSNNEAWKAYPSREYSVVGASSIDKAKNYNSSLYILIPIKKSTKIAVASSSDLWLSFNTGEWRKMGNLGTFTEELYKLFNILVKKGILDSIPSDKDYNQLKAALKLITVDVFTEFATTYFKKLLNISKGETLYNVITSLLSPEVNKFTLMSTLDFFNNPPWHREIWTDKKCVMIEINNIDALKNKIGLLNEI